jgi:hypothetical protein
MEVARAVIIGVGLWGLYAVAHLLPRLRFEDQQRSQLYPDVPRLSSTTKSVVLIPNSENGEIEILVPERLIPPHTAEQILAHFSEERESEKKYKRLLTSLKEGNFLRMIGRFEPERSLEGEGRIRRRSIFDSFMDNRLEICNALVGVIDQVRWDEIQPEEELTRITIYIISSLTEDAASSILWPLATSLREGHVAEVVGLLKVGAFSDGLWRKAEEAIVCAALTELEFLSKDKDEELCDLPPGPAFDRCYLIGREKWNGALARDEQELTTMVGNALEALLISNGEAFIEENLSPDTLELRGKYSTIGGATVYLPIDEMLHWFKEHFRARIFEKHFLVRTEEKTATNFFRENLSTPSILKAMVKGLPLERAKKHLVEVDRKQFEVKIEGFRLCRPPIEWKRRIDRRCEEVLKALEEWIGQIRERIGLDCDIASERFQRWLREHSGSDEMRQESTLLDELRHRILSMITKEIASDNAGLARTHKVCLKLAGLLEKERRKHSISDDIPSAPRGYEERYRNWQRSFLCLARSRPFPSALFARFLSLAIFATYAAISLLHPRSPFLLGGIISFIFTMAGLGFFLHLRIYNWKAARNRAEYTDLVKELVDFRAEIEIRRLLSSLLQSLGEIVQDSTDVIREVIDSMKDEVKRMMEREKYHLPIGIRGSFIREAKADEELWREVCEGMEEPMVERLPNLWQNCNPESIRTALEYRSAIKLAQQEMIKEKMKEGSEVDLKEIEGRAKEMVSCRKPFSEGGLLELFPLVKSIVDRYIGGYRAKIPEQRIEEFLRKEKQFDPSRFLESLFYKAKPFINLDLDKLGEDPIAVNLLTIDKPSSSPLIDQDLSEMEVEPLRSFDPFSITLLRTVHGFSKSSWVGFERCKRSFQTLHPKDKLQIFILQEEQYPPEGDEVMQPIISPVEDSENSIERDLRDD